MSVFRDDLDTAGYEPWLKDEPALVFLAAEGARQLCEEAPEAPHAPKAPPAVVTPPPQASESPPSRHLHVAAQALGMAAYHLSDPFDAQFRQRLIDAVRTHAQQMPVETHRRAEEALILATDAVEGARALLAESDDHLPELSGGLTELHRAVAALVREIGPGRAAELMLAAAVEPA